MRNGKTLLALGLLAQVASWPALGAANLGFDPAKYGLPIYPNATLRPGTANAIKTPGRVRRSAVLTTADAEDKVATWYAAHWRAARHRAFPHLHMDQFSSGWGATSVSVSITNPTGETEIRLMVPSVQTRK